MDVELAKRILGITDEDNGASAKIKFRKLIARYHPDVTGSDSREYQEMAQLINAAYSLLKSEDFFLTRTVSEVLWKELINESVFTSRNVYAPYHMDIDAGDLYQKVTHGKYMWDPEEEEFSLFLRSIYHAARDLLDAAESECRVFGYTDELRASFQERLFHCLAMQFVEPAECLSKIADPETIDQYGRKIYRFRAFVGEKQNLDRMRRIASLRTGEVIYPKSLRNARLELADKNGGSLGHLSFEDDELYYCLYPFMSARMAQIKLTVRKVQTNKGNYLRHAKAELEFLIRLAKEADQYKNPDMNQRIEKILADYKIQIRKIG